MLVIPLDPSRCGNLTDPNLKLKPQLESQWHVRLERHLGLHQSLSLRLNPEPTILILMGNNMTIGKIWVLFSAPVKVVA